MIRPRVAYFVTYPRDFDPAREAIAQDVVALRTRVDGQVHHIAPLERLRRVFPERLFGLWLLPALRRIETNSDVIHVLHGQPRFFPLLRSVRRPIIYSVMAGLDDHEPVSLKAFASVAALTVSVQRDATALRAQGLRQAEVLRPGIDLVRFPRLAARTYSAGEPFSVVVASAPWSDADFVRKGVDALLDSAVTLPNLRLVFLWRGVLAAEMRTRIAARGLGERVTLVDGRADMAATLTDVHAAALLVTDASVVKAYPHSLMEALACGRPVLLSKAIPMADEVEAAGTGVVTPGASPADARLGLVKLMANYAAYATQAAAAPRESWSRERWLDAVIATYHRVM